MDEAVKRRPFALGRLVAAAPRGLPSFGDVRGESHAYETHEIRTDARSSADDR